MVKCKCLKILTFACTINDPMKALVDCDQKRVDTPFCTHRDVRAVGRGEWLRIRPRPIEWDKHSSRDGPRCVHIMKCKTTQTQGPDLLRLALHM